MHRYLISQLTYLKRLGGLCGLHGGGAGYLRYGGHVVEQLHGGGEVGPACRHQLGTGPPRVNLHRGEHLHGGGEVGSARRHQLGAGPPRINLHRRGTA
jgi:hypothetical protein